MFLDFLSLKASTKKKKDKRMIIFVRQRNIYESKNILRFMYDDESKREDRFPAGWI